MTPSTVLLTVLAYFAVMFAISSLSARKRADNSTFFSGGRRIPWPLVAISTIGASISGVTFISVPGMVAAKGYAYLQMVMGFIIGYAAIAFVLVPVFYRRNLVSIYGYLEERFGRSAHRAGAWFFFVSKLLGASVRFLVVCAVLQTLMFAPAGLPFELNAVLSAALVWLFTARGGVRSVIWTDVLKSMCLILAVVLSIAFVGLNLGLDLDSLFSAVGAHDSSQIFFTDDPRSASYFWKQFTAGIFMAIAMNGLDQDMMQRNLACRDSSSARKNMIVGAICQFFVIALFLVLGTVLTLYVETTPGLTMPDKSDELFGLVAAHESMPAIVGIVFIVGLVAAAWSAAGSAMTSLTTSFTVDIMQSSDTASVRRRIHVAMAALMAVVIIIFYRASDQDAISAVYTLASYTYGPILGLFAFGLTSKRTVADRAIPAICLAAPLLSWLTSEGLRRSFAYETGFELLIINALFTVAGLTLFARKKLTAYA